MRSTLVFLCTIAYALFSSVNAQTHKAWIYRYLTEDVDEVYIDGLDFDSIYVFKSIMTYSADQVHGIPFDQVDYIKFQSTNRWIKPVGLGLIGAVVGGIIGIVALNNAEADTFDKALSALAQPAIGIGVGALAGCLVGFALNGTKNKIKVNGHHNPELVKYSRWQQMQSKKSRKK